MFGPKNDNAASARFKLIRYDFPDNKTLVHREGDYPIRQDSKVIVSEQQTVLFVRNGQIYERFEAGEHILNSGMTGSMLKTYIKAYEGGENGVPMDIYFFNKLISAPMNWGMPGNVLIKDPTLDDMQIKIGANGFLRYRITNPIDFFHANMSANVEELDMAGKARAVGHFASELRKLVQTERIGFYDLAAHAEEISEKMKNLINAKITGTEGFQIVEFNVREFFMNDESLQLMEGADASSYAERKAARTAAYRRNVEGYSYDTEQMWRMRQGAVTNEGASGGMMGTMMGAAIGMNLGNQIGGMVDASTPQAAPAPAGGLMQCPACGASAPAGAKFCASCGNPIPTEPAKRFCTNCGTSIAADARFCPNCGQKQ